MKVPVYLVCEALQDRAGVACVFRERRLVRQGASDKVLAIIEAPRGTRIRSRADQNGPEQLVIPMGSSFWARIWGRRHVVPVKYVIDTARRGQYGLSLVSWQLPVADGGAAVGAGSA